MTFKILRRARISSPLISGRKGLLRDQKKKERASLSLRPRTDAELFQFPKEAEAGELQRARASSGMAQVLLGKL